MLEKYCFGDVEVSDVYHRDHWDHHHHYLICTQEWDPAYHRYLWVVCSLKSTNVII